MHLNITTLPSNILLNNLPFGKSKSVEENIIACMFKTASQFTSLINHMPYYILPNTSFALDIDFYFNLM